MVAVLSTCYLKKLGEKQKRYCRQGHDNEKKFLIQFHEHSQQGLTLEYTSESIYESPLVQSTERIFDLDSTDAELVYTERTARNDDDLESSDEDDDRSELKTMPIEIKSRLSHSTFYEERERFITNLGVEQWEKDEPVYVEVDAENQDFFRWIPKTNERFQLLHHVAIRKATEGLIIVGDENKVMFGVFINYKQETIDAYNAVLQDIYDRVLKPFYESDPLELDEDKIKKILETKQMKPFGLDYHSFITDLYVWRKLRIEKTLRLPLPPCNRILPYMQSFWNNNKGGSDAISKLMANSPVLFASVGSAQTVVFGRLLQLFAILQHREYHAARASRNLEDYASLYHIRNTNNKHFPLDTTLEQLTDWLITEADNFKAMMKYGANYCSILHKLKLKDLL